MKKIIKYCLFAVLSLVHFQSCAHEELFVDDQVILTEEIVEYVNEDTATKDPVFIFDPERWGVVQGRVSDDVALKNRDILNAIMVKLVDMGISTMEIGTMDAYFKVDVDKTQREVNVEGSIQVPSNFHLKMSDDTYLRVQPNGSAIYSLMTTYLADNTTISGGNLVGDRFEHDYSPYTDGSGVQRNVHGWGYLIWIIGSENIVIENINMAKAIGDGLVFHSEGFRNDDGSLKPGKREVNNVIVRNVNVDECRRNGISILDGRNITFDNCNVTNTGNGDQAYDSSGKKIASSSGVAPKYGMDLEAIRTRDADGVLEEHALIEGITIKNSRFTNNEAGDIVIYTANNVVVDNNYFDKWVGTKASHTVTIKNNTFESRDSDFSFGINVNSFLDPFGKELNYNYQVLNNTVKGYRSGIRVSGENQIITGNRVENCQDGISFSNVKNAVFSNNIIRSNVAFSYGYRARNTNAFGVEIKNEDVEVSFRPIDIRGLNEDLSGSNLEVSFMDSKFYSTYPADPTMYFQNSKNIRFENIESNTSIRLDNTINFVENNFKLIN